MLKSYLSSQQMENVRGGGAVCDDPIRVMQLLSLESASESYFLELKNIFEKFIYFLFILIITFP